ncbi:hypothetical protein LTR56_021910 [Elasticomyces elasticus]|nr:hypothetical protein LTR56_021910 [Elasticomyces elasticus]KAK3643547.1 hypothetical protein LTR22_015650 [Elasticomyces elasticus]KAK4915055.1 hypothetical protein LTR49_016804 [Elasticomyces elasticus]KAK5751093.1 hypothetical protein LTS12_018816 [Elasticomyces elasticus]
MPFIQDAETAGSAPLTYVPASLYGGAITCLLPSNFADVSDLRQVPDHQEVYLDKDGYTSIVVDILERVEKENDQEALKYHLKDLVQEDEGEVTTWDISEVKMGKLQDTIPAYTLLATTPPGARQRGRAHEPVFVGVLLLLIRLVEQKTDVLVAVNVPHIPGHYVAGEVDLERRMTGGLLRVGGEIREKIVESLEIKDWELFVQE